MATALQTTDARKTFREVASDRFHSAADMSLHELVDEFARLTEVIDGDTTPSPDEYGSAVIGEAGKVAIQERQVINGAARARFGLSFSTYAGDNTF